MALGGQTAIRLRLTIGAAIVTGVFAQPGHSTGIGQTTDTLVLRGKPQTVRLYGMRGSGDPVVVVSGDGGWIHLGPHVAEALSSRGFFVVGFDSKAYLESFTSGTTTLQQQDEPRDFHVVAEYAARGSSQKPLLVGVSEGAGLAVLAATDPPTRQAVAGIVGLGLGDINELGWRWRDSIIYLTHRVPREPTFSTAAVVRLIAPLPLAAIHATHDEYVPLDEVRRVLERAPGPTHLWVIDAANHRFSDKLPEFDAALVEAIDWIRKNAPR